MPPMDHATEIRSGERFAFGANWARFLKLLEPSRIARAEASLSEMLALPRLDGLRFLDIGSGSGLFSLAARRLGASVHSFDYDPLSVACTTELRRRYHPDDPNWTVERGSALDADYLTQLGTFDIVYSWGVLHHTGQMWKALELAGLRVKRGGTLFIAIYNDQGRGSVQWKQVKRAYNRLPGPAKWLVLGPGFVRLWGPTTVRDLLRGRPGETWRRYTELGVRGMSPWHDVVDWVGGWPFEVATPDEIFNYYRARGFELRKLNTCAGGHGCNEFVFELPWTAVARGTGDE